MVRKQDFHSCNLGSIPNEVIMQKRKSKREIKHWFLDHKRDWRKQKALVIEKILKREKLDIFKK